MALHALVASLLLVPTLLIGQGRVRGDKEANWKEIGKASQSGMKLSNRDIENASPVHMLLEKRKDLRLTDEQANLCKTLDQSLEQKNESLFRALDSLRNEMKPALRASEEDDARKRSARGGVMAVLKEIRANQDASFQAALAALDESQQKTAAELLAKLKEETDQMLREKLGGRG